MAADIPGEAFFVNKRSRQAAYVITGFNEKPVVMPQLVQAMCGA
jgi:hypothetical protein